MNVVTKHYSPFRGLRVHNMTQYDNSGRPRKIEIKIVIYDDNDAGIPYAKDELNIMSLVDPSDNECGHADRLTLLLDALCRFLNTGGSSGEIGQVLHKMLGFINKNNYNAAFPPDRFVLIKSESVPEISSYAHCYRDIATEENDENMPACYSWLENMAFIPVDYPYPLPQNMYGHLGNMFLPPPMFMLPPKSSDDVRE